MAGESPGKSDQQKSSGETARGARDPRLTAFREGEAEVDGGRSAVAVAEDAADGTASAEAEAERPEAAGDGDALDVRESEGSESAEAEAESEDAEGAEATSSGLPVRPGAASSSNAEDKSGESGESGKTEKPEGSDARLREAVAAWVSSDDSDADGAAGDAKSASGGEGSGADRPAEAAADAEGDEGDEDEGASSDSPVDQKTAVFRTAKAEPDAEGDEDAKGGAERTAEATSDADGDGQAASGAQGDDDAAKAESGLKEDAGTSGAKGTAEAASDADGDAGDAKAASGDRQAASDAQGDDDADSGAKGDSGASGGGAATSRSAKAAADAEGDEDRKGADADADSGAKGEDGEGASSKAPIDRKTAEFRTAKAADDDADGGDKRASGERRPTWAGGDDDDKSSGSGVDQKTAVFRAPKVEDKAEDKKDDEGGKALDRPTAAFGVLPEKKKRSEGENERTSKFVPLRSTDDPAPAPAKAKPEAKAKAEAKAPAKPDTAPAKPADVPETERTKQQPLPPQTPDGKQPAPLDLLAQLTNKPPKPETPVRTAVRRVKIWTPLVLLLVVILGVAQAVRPLPDPELKLTADASYAFKGDKLAMPWSGEGQSAAEVEGVGSLGTSGEQKPVPIASVTKVMTAYVVLKEHPLKAGAEGPRIKIDPTAAKESESADESRASVKAGQSFTQHQLLQLLLINSSNNIARLLARWDAGSLDAFIKKMNDAAKSLGMKNTTYTDPSGLKESTKSTAADQLKLAKAAMQSDAFREVVATPNTDIPGLDGKIYNNNNLLVKPGVIGIKTGSSTPAGGALMWAAVRTIEGKKQRILGVVLEQRAPTTLDASLQLAQTESYKLISTVQDALTSATVVKKGDVVGQVDDGLGGTTPVVATKDLKAVGWAGLNVDIKIGDGGKTIPHTAKAGTVVGEVTVGSGPGQVKAPVALENDLSEPSFGAKLTRIS
ncbi:D-alanyl-D-alanine carboxypeptidase [Streptomyces sp. NPDC021098]|uniref:D-alanyl-D-alanine carboxypeptidase n=1 Tax=unclassified Streptomyces TaxID=2593676 RepID=UPI0037BB20F0